MVYGRTGRRETFFIVRRVRSLLLALLIAGTLGSIAAAPAAHPPIFFGAVTVGGEAVAAGTLVSA